MGVDRGVDSVLTMLRPQKHALTVDDVQRTGGRQGVYAFRARLANHENRHGQQPERINAERVRRDCRERD
ncbi:hypothetical protein [Pseudoclavibacter sp. VKM Ac-2867]|uniref:hypothetical protein n=1 Tax=Pseudoclavibacter sp. VKM Ac-2867 TaxID=2783829 RepID=UPI00188A5939|nr:hypothetical protein [Pseudoclavibacter sp. VKM Ac-2867]MBF4460348.1 hypothetical protein [Pseudoclavibacter sp. VKM Ac-2867]